MVFVMATGKQLDSAEEDSMHKASRQTKNF